MRFRGPMAQADHFECDGAVEAFLLRAINYALTAPADFLQQFVVTKVAQAFLSAPRCSPDLVAADTAAGVIDPGYRFVLKQTKTSLQQASRADSSALRQQEFLPRTFRKR